MVSTRSVSTSDSSSSRSQSPSPELSWRHQGWQREQLPLYHHFITTTATTLFRSDHVNFWRDQVAQMSFGVDIVYEALLAVGAIHRAALISCQSGNSHEAAKFRVLGFYSYGRVLKLIPELLTRDDPSDMLALLIALMLLTYFEVSCPLSRHSIYSRIAVLRRKCERSIATSLGSYSALKQGARDSIRSGSYLRCDSSPGFSCSKACTICRIIFPEMFGNLFNGITILE